MVFAVLLAAMFYTHNWSLFFAVGCGVGWLGMLAAAPSGARRELLIDGLIGFGGALVLFAPWLPTLLFQAKHTGAPWSTAPSVGDLLEVPSKLFGAVGQIALLLSAGVGIVALLDRSEGRLSPRGRALLVIAGVFVVTVLAAWVSSQVSPAWACRYLAVALAPLLLVAAAGLAHAGRLGVAAVIVVALIWAGDGAPSMKSNVRSVSKSIAPSLQPGDLVISTQPEQIPVLHYYLPDGLRYATLWGPVDDLGVTDWRDGVARMRGTTAQRDLAPLLDADAARPAGGAGDAGDRLHRGVARPVDAADPRALDRVARLHLQRPAVDRDGRAPQDPLLLSGQPHGQRDGARQGLTAVGHSPGNGARSEPGSAEGSSSRKHVPWPSSPTSVSEPPMRSASSRPMARPRPKPPSVPAVRPRWKRSKISSRSAGWTPGPRSATSMNVRSASHPAERRIGSPFGA